MLFGIRRGMPLTLALATTLGLGLALASSARADGMLFQHTIPREVDAYDFTTGGPFMAPPVPNGHYAKDYVAEAHKYVACVACQLHGLMGGGVGTACFHKGMDDTATGCGTVTAVVGHGHGGAGDGSNRVRRLDRGYVGHRSMGGSGVLAGPGGYVWVLR